jgi:NTP pyrophosphatase (non-canonical NTP hydrolase)
VAEEGSVMDLDKMQHKIGTWASETFNHTEQGIALHLLREAVELALAAGVDEHKIQWSVSKELLKEPKKNTIAEETADVVILALAMAHHVGFSLHDSVAAKHVVNVVRIWSNPDEQGVTEHVEVAG